MRGHIGSGVGHRSTGALWASVLGLAVASGTALASGPDPGDLPDGSAILGLPDPDAQYTNDSSWSGGGTPGSAPGTGAVGSPGGLPQADLLANIRDRGRGAPRETAAPDDDALRSLLNDFTSDLVGSMAPGARRRAEALDVDGPRIDLPWLGIPTEQICSAEDPAAALAEAALLAWLLGDGRSSSSGPHPGSSAGPRPGSGVGGGGPGAGSGTLAADLLSRLCRDGQRSGGRLGRGFRPPIGSGCAFSLVVDDPPALGERIRQCKQAHGSQWPPPLAPDEVAVPAGECGGFTPPSKASNWKAALLSKRYHKLSQNPNYTEAERELWKALTDAYADEFLTDRTIVSIAIYTDPASKSKGLRYTIDYGPERTNTTYWHTPGRVTKVEFGSMTTKTQLKKPPKSEQRSSDIGDDDPVPDGYEFPPEDVYRSRSGRPAGPGEGGCDPTEAVRRAMALFDCVYGSPEFAGATLDPVIYPMGPSGGPEECNEVHVGMVFGSSTGPGVTRPSGPEDTGKGGPTILKPFIPKDPKTGGGGWTDPPKD